MPPENSMAAWLGIVHPDQVRSQRNVAAVMRRIDAYEEARESRRLWLGWLPMALAFSVLLAVWVLPPQKHAPSHRSPHEEAVALFAEEFGTPL